MRKTIGIILAGLGVVILAAALVIKVWVAPNAIKLPDDTTVSTAADGTGSGISLTTGQPFKDIPLKATRHLTTEKGDDDTVVWTMKVKLADPTGTALTAYTDRVAVDRENAEAVNDKKYGEKINDERLGQRDVTHEGLTYHFPFDTKKKTYDFFDANTGKAYPASYDSKTTIDDLDVYKFNQEVPATKVREAHVPGALLGVAAPTVTMDVFYSNQRTLWVEPTTGWIVKASEQAKTTLRAPGTAQDAAVILDSDVTFNKKTVDKLVDRAIEDKDKIDIIDRILPIAGLIGGLVLLIVGLLLWFVGRGRSPQLAPAGTVPTRDVDDDKSSGAHEMPMREEHIEDEPAPSKPTEDTELLDKDKDNDKPRE